MMTQMKTLYFLVIMLTLKLSVSVLNFRSNLLQFRLLNIKVKKKQIFLKADSRLIFHEKPSIFTIRNE